MLHSRVKPGAAQNRRVVVCVGVNLASPSVSSCSPSNRQYHSSTTIRPYCFVVASWHYQEHLAFRRLNEHSSSVRRLPKQRQSARHQIALVLHRPLHHNQPHEIIPNRENLSLSGSDLQVRRRRGAFHEALDGYDDALRGEGGVCNLKFCRQQNWLLFEKVEC